jgi:hypothetical protein
MHVCMLCYDDTFSEIVTIELFMLFWKIKSVVVVAAKQPVRSNKQIIILFIMHILDVCHKQTKQPTQHNTTQQESGIIILCIIIIYT